MSHYVDVVTQITDRDALVKALGRMGFSGKIEVHEHAKSLFGYLGDARKQQAHVIIRKRHVGNASNDIGWEKGEDGRYVSHISQFDQGRYNQQWQDKLYTYYGVEKAKQECDQQGLEYAEEVDEEKRPVLRVAL